MLSKADIISFLKRDPHVARLNFALAKLKVWPDAYRMHLADAIHKDDIKVKFDSAAVKKGAGASYYPGFDTLDLPPGFTLSSLHEKAVVIHEGTHAVIDLQNLGSISAHENEAVGYIAEALYLESAGSPPISSDAIRTESHRIAKGLIASSGYTVSSADETRLVTEIAKNPHYAALKTVESNRFDRNVVKNLFR